MNSNVSNTSTPFLSQECDVSTFPGVIAGCQAESGFWAGYKGITNELRACDSTNSCTPEQKQERLKIICPVVKREYDCLKPVRDCSPNLNWVDRNVRECDAFSASSGSTNTTTSGNGKPTSTTTSGNGKPTNTTTSGNGTKDTAVVSAGFSIQGSLISILAFALLL